MRRTPNRGEGIVTYFALVNKSGKSTLISAPGAFRRILEWQVFKAGGYVDAVAPQYTSQTCPHCGHIASENRPTQALFCCVKCGHTSNADVVAAGNILRKSRAGSDRL